MTLTALVALIALLTGAVNFAYLLWPELRRDPGVEHWADLEVLQMDKNVRYADYLTRPGAVPEARPPGDPSTYGNVIYLRLEMHGFKGRSARLRWYTYNNENGERLPRPYSSGPTFKAKAPTAKSVSEQWVQMPPESGRFRIRFQLYDGDDRLLAVAEGPKFTSFVLPFETSG